MKSILLLLVSFFLLNQLYSQTNYWEGNSTNWHNAANWSLNHVPNSAEDATIPTIGVTYFPNVYSGNAECKNFTIVGGANVELFNGISFHVYGDANISGSIIIDDELTYIYLHDDIFWWSGSQCINNSPSDYGSTIYIYDDWNFESGSNVVLDKVNVTFLPAGSGSSIIECNSATSSFYSISMLKSAASTILLSGSSTQTMQVTYELTIGANNNFYSYSNHDLVVNRQFDNSGHFYFANGNLILNDFDFNIQFNEGDFANNLNMTTNNGYVAIVGDAIVNGDIEINGAGADVWNTLFLGGDFDNNAVGTDIDSINIIGDDIQNIYNLECNTLILDKPSGEMRFPSETSTCDHYDWVQGMYSVNGGTFTINDLVDNGIFGTISVTSGELNIHQDAGQYVDMNATLFISSGVCNVFGGGYESFWSYADDASITMSGGVLDFVDNGIRVYNTASHTFSENITGGIIRTPYHFKIYRDNFTPTGGLVQLYGTPDASIILVAGSNFYDLEIKKSSKNYNSIIHKSRDGEEIKSGKSNAVIATTDLDINGDFTISAGSFTAPSVINMAGDWTNFVGESAFIEGSGLVVFDGDTDQHCVNPGEDFNNLEIDKSDGYLHFLSGSTTCQSLNWTQGKYWVNTGTFTAFDLVDDGIYGFVKVSNSGVLNLHQGTSPDEFVDLNGTLIIYQSGRLNVYGGVDDSYWTYNGDVNIDMSLWGSIRFWDVGIRIYDNPTYTFTENLDMSHIFVSSNFIVERDNFTPLNTDVTMIGTQNAAVSVAPGSYLYDLVIDKSAKAYITNDYTKYPRIKVLENESKSNTVTATSDLDIEGRFSIFDGSFVAPGVMNIGLYWRNLVGESAFIEGTGLVVFDGAWGGMIHNTETFYDLSVDLPSVAEDSLEIIELGSLTVLNNLEILDGLFYMNNNPSLTVGNDLTIEEEAGFKANDGFIYIGGDWDNNNNNQDGKFGFHCGYSMVTFNGPEDQYLFCDYLYEEFNNLTIDKTGGLGMESFEPHSNIRVFNNLEVIDGNWFDTPAGNNHLLFGDLYIGVYGRWTDMDGTISLMESATQSFINDGGGYFDIIMCNKNNPTNQVNLGGNLVFDNLNINTGAVSMDDSYYLNHEGIFVEANASLTLDAGTWLVSDDGAGITVAAGGQMAINGTETDHCVITQNGGSGYFNFNVDGELGADYTEFRFMSANGIQINSGATLTPGHAFNDCDFGNGEVGGTYLTLNNNQTITSDGVSFNLNNWGGSSNVKKTLDNGQITFTNFTGDFSGEDFDDDSFDRIIWDEGVREIDMKVFLEGPFSGGLMETTLNMLDLIPVEQPYDGSPWNYSGSESVVNIPNADIVDWVLVEYRDAPNAVSATPATTIGKQSAFILNNGKIVDIDGASILNFPYTLVDQLFIVVCHRNHLGVLSTYPLTETAGVYAYDFTSGEAQAFGGNLGHKLIGSGVWGMVSGDCDADGSVHLNDKNNVWENTAGKKGYLSGDANLDGQTGNKDKNDKILNNIERFTQIPD